VFHSGDGPELVMQGTKKGLIAELLSCLVNVCWKLGPVHQEQWGRLFAKDHLVVIQIFTSTGLSICGIKHSWFWRT